MTLLASDVEQGLDILLDFRLQGGPDHVTRPLPSKLVQRLLDRGELSIEVIDAKPDLAVSYRRFHGFHNYVPSIQDAQLFLSR